MRHLLLAFLSLVYAQAACPANLSFVLGARDQTDAEDQLLAAGVAVDFGSDDWLVRPELGAGIGLDPAYGGDESELSLGAVKYWDSSAGWVHLGLGLSRVATEFGANSGSSSGVYCHAGMSWGRATRVGFDIRYLNADDFEASGTRFPVGYLQIALLINFGRH